MRCRPVVLPLHCRRRYTRPSQINCQQQQQHEKSAGSSSSSSSSSNDFYSSVPRPSESSSLPHSQQTPFFPPRNFPAAFASNQILHVEASQQERLSKILSQFQAPIRFAFAYGSGVFPQEEAGPEHAKRPAIKDPSTGQPKKMIDFVFAVAHPEHWHGLNRGQFPRHYSLTSRLAGAEFINGIIQRAGAGLWYVPYVKMGDELVKYGVIDIDMLCADLMDWNTLYVSGRMHKPVAMLIADSRVRLAQQVNLASALRVALLLLPKQFTEVELYTRIASLSYTGDFRMSVPGGENANKVRNIVLAQRSQFRRLYSGLIKNLGTIEIHESRSDRYYMIQDTSSDTKASYASKLPLRLREKIIHHYTNLPDLDPAFAKISLSSKQPDENVSRKPDDEVWKDFWLAVVKQFDFNNVVLNAIASTVKAPAWKQSIKGVYTAGFRKSLKYVLAKVGKWFEGGNQKKS
ncbi:unnamed protein product [Sympodiomycopsis kandeliae]